MGKVIERIVPKDGRIGGYDIVREHGLFDRHERQKSLLVAYHDDASCVACGSQKDVHFAVKQDMRNRAFRKQGEETRAAQRTQ